MSVYTVVSGRPAGEENHRCVFISSEKVIAERVYDAWCIEVQGAERWLWGPHLFGNDDSIEWALNYYANATTEEAEALLPISMEWERAE